MLGTHNVILIIIFRESKVLELDGDYSGILYHCLKLRFCLHFTGHLLYKGPLLSITETDLSFIPHDVYRLMKVIDVHMTT